MRYEKPAVEAQRELVGSLEGTHNPPPRGSGLKHDW